MSPTEDISEFNLSVSEVAKALNVQPMTIRRWIGEGRLAARRVPGTKPYKLRQSDVDALIEGSAVVTTEKSSEGKNEGMAGMDSAAMLLEPIETDAP
jgi:excisionase family DNA binding protein